MAVGHGRSKGPGHAEERDVIIEIPDVCLRRDDFDSVTKAVKQPCQRGLHHEHRLRAPLLREKRVPAELYGVAQTLLGIDEKCFPPESLHAGPFRLRMNRILWRSGLLSAPFVKRPALR